MRRFALALALMLSTPAHSDFDLGVVFSSPVSAVLKLGQWIASDSASEKETIEVRVEVTSKDTLEEKRKLAFDKALTEVFGKLTVSDVVVENNKVTKNQILTANSGYVSDFKIVESHGDTIVMDIWVSRSRVADRHLGKKTVDGTIKGKTIAELKMAYDKGGVDRKKMISEVFSDFDEMAFNHSVAGVAFKTDGTLEIDVKSEWNQNFLRAVDEVMETTMTEFDPWEEERFRIKTEDSWISNTYNPSEQVKQIVAEPRQLVFDLGHKQVCRQHNLYPLVSFENKVLFFNSRIEGYNKFSVPLTIKELENTDSVSVQMKRGWCS